MKKILLLSAITMSLAFSDTLSAEDTKYRDCVDFKNNAHLIIMDIEVLVESKNVLIPSHSPKTEITFKKNSNEVKRYYEDINGNNKVMIKSSFDPYDCTKPEKTAREILN